MIENLNVCYRFSDFFLDFLDFFGVLGIPFKVTKVTTESSKVTTGHQKLPKIGQTGRINLGRRPKPSPGARSRPYLPVLVKHEKNYFS